MTKPALPIYVQTMPGVEEIAWLEIKDVLSKPVFREYLFAKEQNGIACFDYNGPLESLLKLRTTEDVFIEAINIRRVDRSYKDLKTITERVLKSESFGRASNALLRHKKLSRPPSFRVISRKYGKHQYRRKDFELAIIRGVQARNPRWTAVADNAQIEVWGNLLGSHLLIGLRLSDRTMRHRFNKKVELPASLRPSLAAAMVFLTRPEPTDIFLDPMCGSGTILLERLASGPFDTILGGDLLPDRVQATRQNIPKTRKGRIRKNIEIRKWDAQDLPIESGAIDKIATNLPFGKQIAPDVNLSDLYANLFAEFERVVIPGGRIIVLSSQFDLLKSCVRRLPYLSIDTGYSISTLGQWGRLYLINRLPE